METEKKLDKAVNEFNQYVKPVSLWADAWKRLRRNKMAVVSLWIVVIYILVTIFAPLFFKMGLLFDYTEQTIIHLNLPPSLQPAGDLVIRNLEKRIADLEKSLEESKATEGGTDYSADTGFNFAAPEDTVSTEGETDTTQEENQDLMQGAASAEASGFVDPVTQELSTTKTKLEEMRIEIKSNPIHKRIYLFGTDDLGRDVFSRVIFGGRISIFIGLLGALTAIFIGVLVGSVSGYIGGWLDNVLMRFVDIMYSLPYMLVVIIIMAMVGNAGRGSIIILFVAIALVSWLTISRVIRGQIISLKNSEFVEAARSMGASTPRIIFRHLVPNVLGIIIIYTTLSMPGFIMNESFLSFLGLGVSAPDASWGTLVSEGVRGMELRPWQLLAPAISMTLFLFSMNFLGDGLRDALDPQSKNRG